jgi:hypothetical protein
MNTSVWLEMSMDILEEKAEKIGCFLPLHRYIFSRITPVRKSAGSWPYR